jgi:hypothetical protein
LGWASALSSPATRACAGHRISHRSSPCRSSELASAAETSKPWSRRRLGWPPALRSPATIARAGHRIPCQSSPCKSAELSSAARTSKPWSRRRLGWPPALPSSATRARVGHRISRRSSLRRSAWCAAYKVDPWLDATPFLRMNRWGRTDRQRRLQSDLIALILDALEFPDMLASTTACRTWRAAYKADPPLDAAPFLRMNRWGRTDRRRRMERPWHMDR